VVSCLARMRRLLDRAAPGLGARLRSQLLVRRPGIDSVNHAREGYFAVAAELGYERADALATECAALVQEALTFWRDMQRRVEPELRMKLEQVGVPTSGWVLPAKEVSYSRLLTLRRSL